MEHKFKVGDKVILEKFSKEDYPYIGWHPDMDDTVGCIGEVVESREILEAYRVKVGDDHWAYPEEALTATKQSPSQVGGWIEWNGGECPVATGTKVEYKCPSAGTFTSEMPEELRWKHIGLAGDIIAYRVVEGAAQGFIPGTTTVDVGEAVQEDSGSAATSKHYNAQAIQPIELMQLSLSPEEFKGFLKGNIMKYSMRAGSKAGESVFKDTVKAKQYKMWLDLVEQGVKIDPRTHVVIKGQ